MRTFEQQQKAPQQTRLVLSKNFNSASANQNRDLNIDQHLLRSVGNQAMLRLLRHKTRTRNKSLNDKNATKASSNFSKLLMYEGDNKLLKPRMSYHTSFYEREANHVADHVMRMSPQVIQPQKNFKLNKRRVDASQAKSLMNEPSSQAQNQTEFSERDTPSRKERIQLRALPGSSIIDSNRVNNIRSFLGSGQQLGWSTRSFMETRFNQDFSQVRIHTDAKAARSAQAIQAKAYTIGRDVIFGNGQYAPHTREGKQLLAHELTHVLQQRDGTNIIQRKIDVDDFEVDEFDQQTLYNYLLAIRSGQIEDNNDSDDKARFIVRQWRRGKPIPLGTDTEGRKLRPNELDAKTKIMLIREMQSGFTGDDDERAILTLLLHSSDRDLIDIFAPSRGLDPEVLDSDFHGDEEDLLHQFFDSKFVGGREAALEGSRKLKIRPKPSKLREWPPRQPRPWRKWARNRIPFDRWDNSARQDALREYRAARRRIFTDNPNQVTKEWFKQRKHDKEIFHLLDPYHDELKDFFNRSTMISIGLSKTPIGFGTFEVKRGEVVTFSAIVRYLDRDKSPPGTVEFFFPEKREVNIIFWSGTQWFMKFIGKAALKDGEATLKWKVPDVQPGMYLVEAKFPGKAGAIESKTSIRLKVI